VLSPRNDANQLAFSKVPEGNSAYAQCRPPLVQDSFDLSWNQFSSIVVTSASVAGAFGANRCMLRTFTIPLSFSWLTAAFAQEGIRLSSAKWVDAVDAPSILEALAIITAG